MKQLLERIQITVVDSIFIKDPSTSELGKRILSNAVDMIVEDGFEELTFRRLASRITTSEASIYRYFENKNKLLLYLTAWYWVWMEYQLVFANANISSPYVRLKQSIQILTEPMRNDLKGNILFDLEKLNEIVITESSKSYLVKTVDEVNKEGVYKGYKKCVERVSNIIVEINPSYLYPQMLISTVIEGAHHQRYFAAHLPRLTNIIEGTDSVVDFYMKTVFASIGAELPK